MVTMPISRVVYNLGDPQQTSQMPGFSNNKNILNDTKLAINYLIERADGSNPF